MIEELLQYNKTFVEKKAYKPYVTDKFPSKKVAILTCMDTRLTNLLPAALGLKNGDVKMIKNAGAVITAPFGSVMRSLVVAVYELGVKEILVIGHHDCGMKSLNSEKIIEKMKQRGIDEAHLDFICHCGVDLDGWLTGFSSPEASVCASVTMIAEHPLMPSDIFVYGLIIDPETGALTRL